MRARAIVLFLALAPGIAGAAVVSSRVERGPVSVRVFIEPEAPVIGDSVILTIEALAEPGVELGMPEFGEALDRFRIVDFAPRESVDADGRTRAVQRYTLEPAQSGPQAIPPLLVEFVDRRPGQKRAPDDEDAFELLSERLEFAVGGLAPADATAELAPMPPRLSARKAAARMWWVLWGTAAAALVAAPFVWRVWSARRARERRRSAHEVASAELARLRARGTPEPEQMDAFFVELSGTVRRYLEARLELRSPELTTEEFLEVAARSPDLSDGLRELLTGFLRRADLVKFARFVPGGEEISASLDAAFRVLDETRDAASDTARPDFFAEPARG